MVFGAVDGLGPGSEARFAAGQGGNLAVSDGWLGRVVDPIGRPMDGRGALPRGPVARPVRADPPDATLRARLGPRIDLGVRVLNAFTTCRQGQRLGLFAGSGVGKSTLLAMLARQTDCDVAVLALVGERGREVREFIEDELGPEGLARSVVVIATSDTRAADAPRGRLCGNDDRRAFPRPGEIRAAHDGQRDPVLRRAPRDRAFRRRAAGHARLSAERVRRAAAPARARRPGAGPAGRHAGQITALFTVLVEGDDHNEPVADAVRGILDGHVILDRRIGEGGRYPAVDVLRSLSRSVPGCLAEEEHALTRRARAVLALYAEMADLVRLGAYKAGSDPRVDEAVALAPRIEAMLRQGKHDPSDLADELRRARRGNGDAEWRVTRFTPCSSCAISPSSRPGGTSPNAWMRRRPPGGRPPRPTRRSRAKPRPPPISPPAMPTWRPSRPGCRKAGSGPRLPMPGMNRPCCAPPRRAPSSPPAGPAWKRCAN